MNHLDECRNRACSGCGPDSDRANLAKLRASVEKLHRIIEQAHVRTAADSAFGSEYIVAVLKESK